MMNLIRGTALSVIPFTFLCTTFLFSQTTVFSDNFDSYLSGQQLACQNPTDWTTWSLSPCNATEDAYISNTYSVSGNNSVVIIQNNDLVRDHGLLSGGICEIIFQIYIPEGKAGYFNTLANFAPPTYVWAMQVFFDSPGTGRLDAAGETSATFNYPHNSWISVKVVADLVGDQGEFWLNGLLIHSWQWSKGVFGTSTIPLQVDATDFYGNTANDEMYIDDFSVRFLSKIRSTYAGGIWSSSSTWVGGVVPTSNVPVEIVNTATVNLDSDIIRNAGTLTNGRLNFKTNIISGASSFVLSSNGTLEIHSPLGISSSGATGNLQVTGLRILNPGTNFIYAGTSPQITGDGLPSTVRSLTVINSSGITLTNSTIVSTFLTMSSGNISLNGNTLTLGTSTGSTSRGTLNWVSGFLTGTGTFKRWFSTSNVTLGNVRGLFPMGTLSESRNVWVGGTPSTGGTISVQHNDITGTTALSFMENFQNFITRSNLNWVLSNANGFNGINLSLRIQGTGLQCDQISDLNICIASGAAGGIYSAPTGNTANPQVNRTGLTQVTLANTFYFASVDEALPVELTAFSAAIVNNSVMLNWETATEVNNYGFDVERKVSHNPSERGEPENNRWGKIGFVVGNGNCNSPKCYSFEDKNASTGKCCYRLKQIDNDGSFEYSQIVEIDINQPVEFGLSQNYPNPFNPSATINFNLPEEGFVSLKVFNTLGQLVRTLVDEVKQQGVHSVNFDAGELGSGVYVYKIDWGGNSIMNKMTMIK